MDLVFRMFDTLQMYLKEPMGENGNSLHCPQGRDEWSEIQSPCG